MTSDEPATAIKTIKGVRLDAWERARRAADKADETMGEWASRAFDRQADQDGRTLVLAPQTLDQPGIPPSRLDRQDSPPPPPDMAGMAQLVDAMTRAGVPLQKRVQSALNALLYNALRPPTPHKSPASAEVCPVPALSLPQG